MTTWYTKEDEKIYHDRARRGEAVGSHQLAKFRKSPAIYHAWCRGMIDEPDSDAFALGRAVHTLVLEGEQIYQDRYVISDGPINPKTGKPYGRDTKAHADWRNATPDLEVISTDEAITCRRSYEAVHSHPIARDLLREGGHVSEITARARVEGINCQARIDAWRLDTPDCHPVLIDLKTTQDLDYFEYDAKRFGYFRQLGFYSLIARLAGATAHATRIIAVEKAEPFRVGVWAVTDTQMDAQRAAVLEELKMLKECMDAGDWTDKRYSQERIADL